MKLNQIDWNQIWKEAMEEASWEEDGVDRWNEMATHFKRPKKENYYLKGILKKLNIDSNSTVLDIGCGPGTLTIPLAKKVKSVTALDVSGEMLKLLRERAKEEGLNNITYINKAWEDVVIGEDIKKHDIVIASRSLCMFDLKEALFKMNNTTRKYAYLTVCIGNDITDREICIAVGKEYHPGPGYICVYNLLFQMGIYADVEILNYRSAFHYSNLEEVADFTKWKLRIEGKEQEGKLKKYLLERLNKDDSGFKMERTMAWALIKWKKKS
ncbi:MAG: class I SAM-dependent methyltransferase [Atribacterota bacterium]|nr:class I SAM-dependent methyltransferase [Atribacterota bacterium]